MSKTIPEQIVALCLKFYLQEKDEWLKGGDKWIIDENECIATKTKSWWQTIYGTLVISQGKYTWKIKIAQPPSWTFIGIASSMHCCDTCFAGVDNDVAKDSALNYAYKDNGHKLSHEFP